MKIIILLTVFSLSSIVNASNVVSCVIIKDKKIVKEIDSFGINNFETEEPESVDIDGGLLDYKKTKKIVKMSFSNDCDNIYEFEFSAASIKKAKNGVYKKLIGKAHVGLTGDELEVTGTVSCDVVK